MMIWTRLGRFWLFLAVLALCIGLGAGEAIARKQPAPSITDLLITNDETNVLLYARLVDGFRSEMDKAILTGVPITFTLHLKVYRERSLVWDRTLASRVMRRTIKYDSLKKTFTITTDGNSAQAVVNDFDAAQKVMSDFSGVKLLPIAELEKGSYYYAEVYVKVDRVSLPLYLEYVFFFVSLWDVETPTYKQRFTY